jgi:hypothetical protein
MRRFIYLVPVALVAIGSAGLAARYTLSRQEHVPVSLVMTRRTLGPGEAPPRPRPRTPQDWWCDLSFPDVPDVANYASPRPGLLAVRALADINNPVPDVPDFHAPDPSYFWRLRVSRANDPRRMVPVFEHEYRDQVFKAAHGTHITPKFEQLLPLEAGRYFVQLSLAEVHRRADGSLESTQADGSLLGPLSSFWAVVK